MRSLRWSLWIGLGAFVVVAASSCSSSDSKKKPHLSYESGANAGGDANVPSGGDEGQGGASNPSGAGAAGESAGAAGAGTMTDGWLSGTRLRATLYVSGSSKMFKTWHDTELDLDCSFAVDANGDERCLPGFDLGYGAYSDSKCTKPVVALGAAAVVPHFVMGPIPPFECGKGARYLKVGATAVGVTDLFSNSSGTCQPNGIVGADQIVKTLGAAVPEAMFVAATEVVQEPRDERLSANVRVAEDGSREVISHYDLTRRAECNPREHEGDGYGCVPEDRAYIEYFFADDKCMIEAAYHPAYAQQVCGRPPTIIQNSSPYFTDGYYEVGEKVSTVYRKDSGCAEYTSSGDAGATYYTVGKAVPFTSFPALSSMNEGKGRMLLQILRGSADELVSREDFYDTTLGTRCGWGEAADHETRCIPRYTSGPTYYADTKCKQALYVTTKGEAPTPFADFLTTNAIDGGSLVFRRDAKIATPAKNYQLNGVDCMEAPVDANADYYATTAIAPGELALVSIETE